MAKLIKFEWALKKLLRNKANFNILEGFLSELLKQDIKIEEILESESNKNTFNDKSNRVDLMVKTGTDERIIIEVQCTSQWDYLSRILLYGTSKTIVENMREGDVYAKVKKIISVSILYFDLGQGEDYIYVGRTEFTGMHRHDKLKLSENEQAVYKGNTEPGSVFPDYYLIKVNQFNEVAKDTFDEWVYFLKTEKIENNFKAKGLKEAKQNFDILKLDEKERSHYKNYLEDMSYESSIVMSHYESGKREGKEEGFEKGIKRGIKKGLAEGLEQGKVEGKQEGLAEGIEQGKVKGRQEGLTEGIEKGKVEVARKMLEQGLDISLIEQITGLTKKEIERTI